MEKFSIYGFCGKLGSGKHFVAKNVLLPMLPSKPSIILSFSDTLKIDAIVKDGLKREHVFEEKDQETREALQKRGTEDGRTQYGDDIWIKYMEELIYLHVSRGIRRILITDVRFPNEIEFIRRHGGVVIQVVASLRNKQHLALEADNNTISQHISENALNDYHGYDFVLHNDPNQQIDQQARQLVQQLEQTKACPLTIFCDLDDTICTCNSHYLVVTRQVQEMVWQHLTEAVSHSFFAAIFEKAVQSHNNNYQETPYYRERYAEIMVQAVNEFATFIHPILLPQIRAQAYNIGMTVHDSDFTALPGALEALEELNRLGNLVIYTVGHRIDQVRKLIRLGISQYCFEIVDHKDVTMIRNLKARYPSQRYVILGDSLKADILPALEAKMDRAILIGSSGGSQPANPAYSEAMSLWHSLNYVRVMK